MLELVSLKELTHILFTILECRWEVSGEGQSGGRGYRWMS